MSSRRYSVPGGVDSPLVFCLDCRQREAVSCSSSCRGVIDVPRSAPLEFLSKAQEDPELSARLVAALEKGGKVTDDEVLRIAEESGYPFTADEFHAAVRRDFAERFAAGEEQLADVAKVRVPLESSCAKGCLSLTKSWHPVTEPGS